MVLYKLCTKCSIIGLRHGIVMFKRVSFKLLLFKAKQQPLVMTQRQTKHDETNLNIIAGITKFCFQNLYSFQYPIVMVQKCLDLKIETKYDMDIWIGKYIGCENHPTGKLCFAIWRMEYFLQLYPQLSKNIPTQWQLTNLLYEFKKYIIW